MKFEPKKSEKEKKLEYYNEMLRGYRPHWFEDFITKVFVRPKSIWAIIIFVFAVAGIEVMHWYKLKWLHIH